MAGGDFGLRAVRAGSNVHNPTLDDLNYDSTYPALKQLDPLKVSPSTPDGVYTIDETSSWLITLTHNLGYFPSYIAWLTDEVGNVIGENQIYNNGTYGITFSVSGWSTTQIFFSVGFIGSAPPGGTQYKITVMMFLDQTGF